jgi:hypothetical protein
MVKLFFMYNIKQIFEEIINGDKKKSTEACRGLRKFVYSRQGEKNKYDGIQKIIDNAPETYKNLLNEWQQENFVLGISIIYFLRETKNKVDYLFDWLYKLLEHSNGIIRYSAIKMLEHDLGSLTVHTRHPGHTSDEVKPKKAEEILFLMFNTLNHLSNKYFLPKYKKFKYVQSLPASSYKSIQMVLGTLDDYCGDKFFTKIVSK